MINSMYAQISVGLTYLNDKPITYKKNQTKNLIKSHVPHPMKNILEVGFSDLRIFSTEMLS